MLVTYKTLIAGFLVQDRLGKVQFFGKTFLLADTSMKVVLEMLFLTFFNTDIWFAEKKLKWRGYLTPKALPINQRVKLIDKREFAAVVIDENAEIFMVYVVGLSTPTMPVHLSRQA